MSLCHGDAFETLRAEINLEERKKAAHAKPFPHTAISYVWAVISAHVDNVSFLFKTYNYNHPLTNPFPLSSFVPINHPYIFLLSDQEVSYLEALQLPAHMGSVIIHLLKCPCFVLKNTENGTKCLSRKRNHKLIQIFVFVFPYISLFSSFQNIR